MALASPWPCPRPPAKLRPRRRRFAEVTSRLCLTFSFPCWVFGWSLGDSRMFVEVIRGLDGFRRSAC
jgi:hypothetical protein